MLKIESIFGLLITARSNVIIILHQRLRATCEVKAHKFIAQMGVPEHHFARLLHPLGSLIESSIHGV